MSTCKSGKHLEVNDDFESGSLSKIWTGDKLIPGALSFQSGIVRSGTKSAMMVIHQGDQIEEEKGTILERTELKESRKLFSSENLNYEYSFSIFLPPDFPQVPTRLVIAQWKQNCPSGNCKPDNPVIALRYTSGEFFITLKTSTDEDTLYSQKENILNQWLDFRFNIRFSGTKNGCIKAWLNSKQIIDFNGITAYSKESGYPDHGKFYFKIGLYRDQTEQPMTLYFDNYSKKRISDS
jgi:Polysaccharide lyase